MRSPIFNECVERVFLKLNKLIEQYLKDRIFTEILLKNKKETNSSLNEIISLTTAIHTF